MDLPDEMATPASPDGPEPEEIPRLDPAEIRLEVVWPDGTREPVDHLVEDALLGVADLIADRFNVDDAFALLVARHNRLLEQALEAKDRAKAMAADQAWPLIAQAFDSYCKQRGYPRLDPPVKHKLVRVQDWGGVLLPAGERRSKGGILLPGDVSPGEAKAKRRRMR